MAATASEKGTRVRRSRLNVNNNNNKRDASADLTDRFSSSEQMSRAHITKIDIYIYNIPNILYYIYIQPVSKYILNIHIYYDGISCAAQGVSPGGDGGQSARCHGVHRRRRDVPRD